MPRPKTKEELITASNTGFEKLFALLDSASPESLNGEFHFDSEKNKEAHWQRDKNIKDALCHLYEWQELLINFVTANQKGMETSFLPAGYNWKTYGQMNIEFRDKHQKTTYDEAVQLLKNSHRECMNLLSDFSNDELFSKGVYKWTGGTTLGSYFTSSTSSHYDWATKKIRKYLKSL
ncbi:ClbS/DfsB family four-helix bundle protein [Lactobacillus sp. YT155]|uniref:ClbS/DfsB family four-helix bundle protein n=1 Tax=Lactobacillus sp. YT155 TaxID=3060955 RepID=UPI00265F3273|nr:ClbS/DfsB family four-helix bundle protein [Lactobacillus sp. YT155]MDO1604621.1 ClbS/DfsB family four-helix bundle protein [Lactobacillus sp. YT155]